MTDDDDLMDARLRAAGERWRAATAVTEHDYPDQAAAPDFEPRTAKQPRRRTWAACGAAAATVAAIGVGVGILAGGTGSHQSVADGRAGQISQASQTSQASQPNESNTGPVGRQVPTVPAGLPGKWTLTAPAGYEAFLALTDTGYAVELRCEQLSGSINYAGDVMTFGTPKVWQHSCPPAPDQPGQNRFDRMVRNTLDGATTWSLDGGTLTIVKNGTSLVFVPARPGGPGPSTTASSAPIPLAGSWALQRISDSSVDGTVSGPNPLTLTITAAGRFSVTNACRLYKGRVQVDGSTATFTMDEARSPHSYRPGECGLPQEQNMDSVVGKMLSNADTWSAGMSTLVLDLPLVGKATFVRS